MLKAAQRKKPDLATWLRPTLKVSRTPEFERRLVEPWEYATLVQTLLNPPLAPSRRAERNALWRDAGDAVQLMRLTGGRLNEILRIKLWQVMWSKNVLKLEATKTENERDIPLWTPIKQLIQARTNEGLIGDGYLFARAKTATFDNAISRACLKAGRAANLDYGRENGFTLHSLRHTFITEMMEATNNDIALVMSWSGHKSLESFRIYLHPTEKGVTLGEQRATQVADLARTFIQRPVRDTSQPTQFARKLEGMN